MADQPIEIAGYKMEYMRGAHHFHALVVFPVAIVLCAVLAGLWPATRAARMSPAAASRHR